MDPMHNFRTQLLETKLYLSLRKKKKKKKKTEHGQIEYVGSSLFLNNVAN